MSVGLYAAIYFILNICRDAQYITLHDMSSFDSIGLYLFFRSLFFVYLFVYTTTASIFSLVGAHYLGIFRYGMYSNAMIISVTIINYMIQCIILPDKLEFPCVQILMFYSVSVPVSVLFLYAVRRIAAERYHKCVDSFDSKEYRDFVNETNDCIICFLLPLIGIVLALLASVL